MTDSGLTGRVKALFGSVPEDNGSPPPMPDAAPMLPDPDAQRQALQVLTMAQRTADEHVATAQRQAERIRSEAQASAEHTTRDAQAHAEAARRDADRAVAEAHAQAAEIANRAQAKADELEREAQQRYQEAVGGLAAKRAALQQQIETLQQFDRDYRARLRKFMQGQLRALDIDDPSSSTTEILQPGFEEMAAPPSATL